MNGDGLQISGSQRSPFDRLVELLAIQLGGKAAKSLVIRANGLIQCFLGG